MNGVKYTGFVYRSILIYFRKKNRTHLGLALNFPRQKNKTGYQNKYPSVWNASNFNVIDFDPYASTSRKSIFLTFMTTLLLCFVFFCSQSKYFVLLQFLLLFFPPVASVGLKQISDYIKYTFQYRYLW